MLPGMSDTETLHLIDGSGFIYRAYFGIRAPLQAKDGTPTNAVYGFMRMVQSVLRDVDPRYAAVVFDTARRTFRNELYPEYKANRREPPDDLKPQFSLCREAVHAMGIPALALEGYEADDIIGTVATRWSAAGREVVIVTADKDFAQLVGPHVTLWDSKTRRTDTDGVVDKFGVGPQRVVDVLGLAGDSSDNIPGVPGIGVKTATQLLKTYGDLESLLAAAPEIKGKRGQNLVTFADQARLSRRLATIVCDAPIDADDAALTRREPDRDTLAKFLRRLDFKDVLDTFGLAGHAVSTLPQDGYHTVTTEAALTSTVASIRESGRVAMALCVDAGGDAPCLVGAGLAWSPGAAAYVPLHDATRPDAPHGEAHRALRSIIEDPDLPKLGRDVKRDLATLTRAGFRPAGLADDVLLAAQLIDPNRHDQPLEALSQDLLDHTMRSSGQPASAKGGQLSTLDTGDMAHYATERADVTLRVCDLLLPRLEALGLGPLYREVELPLSGVLARMESHGVRLDCAALASQSAGAATQMASMEVEIHELVGHPFNISSPKQLATVLFDELGLPVVERTKTGPSTNHSVLETLSPKHPLPAKVLAYRHLSKLRGTYLEKLPRMIDPSTQRLHTSFRQIGAATGRIASADPNLQNIPIRTPEGREVRRAFIADPGWKLLSADYSHIELRILAHYSADPGLLGAFADRVDVHTRTAAEVFGVTELEVTGAMRTRAKAVNFGLMYGQGAFGLARALGIERKEAETIIARYFERYDGVKAYYAEALTSARAEKQAKTLFGRIRPLPQIGTSKSRHQARAAQERLAINTPIQGTAADILKRAMVALDRRLLREGLRARMLLTVHDELVLEVPADQVAQTTDAVREEMVGAADLRVPLEVEIGVGENWAEIHG